MAAGIFFLAPALLAGCAAPSGSRSDSGSANVNLNGYPVAFKQGYSDGCNSAGGGTLRDRTRFKSDSQYAQGWRDGYDICTRQSQRR